MGVTLGYSTQANRAVSDEAALGILGYLILFSFISVGLGIKVGPEVKCYTVFIDNSI